MKILWFSNCAFTEKEGCSTGTWLSAMGGALVDEGVNLYNVTYGDVRGLTRQDCRGITQWIIPEEKPNAKGLPSPRILEFIKKIEREVNPDLIHIWGTEYFWGMLAARELFSNPVLLDVQGLLYAYARVFYGNLTIKELIASVGFKELLKPQTSLFSYRKKYKKLAKHERFMLQRVLFVSVQSEWVKAHLTMENARDQEIFSTGMMLRKQFYKAQKWVIPQNIAPVIFTSSSRAVSYKGLYVLFRAVALLKQKYPSIKLKIAGNIHPPPKRWFSIKDGYSSWLLKEAKKLGILASLEWLGPLDADAIIKNLQMANVFCVPSFVETYCVALAEAMILGVPAVVSYAGAMPELAEDGKSALFFPPGDFVSCAWQIERFLKEPQLSERISENSKILGEKRNDPQKVVARQLEIYKTIMEK